MATTLPEEQLRSVSARKARLLRVLIVEDDPDAGESLAILLGLYGHEAHVARDGPAALQEAQAHSPDVVLLDIGLPGMDGRELATRLRQQAAERRTLLVAVTGYGQE